LNVSGRGVALSWWIDQCEPAGTYADCPPGETCRSLPMAPPAAAVDSDRQEEPGNGCHHALRTRTGVPRLEVCRRTTRHIRQPRGTALCPGRRRSCRSCWLRAVGKVLSVSEISRVDAATCTAEKDLRGLATNMICSCGSPQRRIFPVSSRSSLSV
jgi:hypothetical protein